MPDVDVVLIMEPDTLADPGPVADVQLPRKLDAGPRSKNDAVSDVGSESAQHTNPKA
ncbi:ABC-type sugar transport system, periplasmic component [Microbacterium testaceum StLB037]|uniref:ABC-type sugar transport system, periplasmic component n=1 Tax=Microbacterium testaceum (strain StLB037) TaxID=979556 RepID=E8NFF3_MICTS|nr:ABC-type sugar transport system, periplasmic component [Microbacterium testaceum StLB037]